MHIHLNQGVIRGYAEGMSFENRDPFIFSMNFLLLNAETIFISSLIAKRNFNALEELRKELEKMKVSRIIADLPTAFMPRGFKPLSDTGLYILNLRSNYKTTANNDTVNNQGDI